MNLHDSACETGPRTSFDTMLRHAVAPPGPTSPDGFDTLAGAGLDDDLEPGEPPTAEHTRTRVVAGAVGIALAPSLLGILLLWAASALGSREAVVWAAAQAALLCGAGIAYLLWRLWTPTTTTSGTRGLNLARVDSLTSRAAVAETTNRLHEETLHEVRATVAGLVTAAQLLGHPDTLDATTRTRLQTMFDSELSRLQRIVSQRRSHRTESVELDAAITPVVESLRTRGHAVRWVPTGKRVSGCPDDITEVVHILLENAANHAGGALIGVDVHPRGNALDVRVWDTGPGVSPRAAATIFERGARRQGSPGQGIGLHVASKLMRSMGGSLVLDRPRREGGAAFTMRLPCR